MQKAKKIVFAFTIAVFLIGLIACSGKKSAEVEIEKVEALDGGNLNVIFITTDQERYFEEFPVGSEYRARELLKELGTSFEKHYICSNVSSSSRSVIYTGRHVTETEVHDNIDFGMLQRPMNTDIKTVGTMMRELGYYTAFKGKSHFTASSAVDPAQALIPTSNEDVDLIQTTNDMEPYGFSDYNKDGDYAGGPLQGYQKDPVITSTSIEWLRGKGNTLNNDGTPFFLSINLVNPHDIMYADADAYGDNSRIESNPTFPIKKAPKDILYSKTYPKQPLHESTLKEKASSDMPSNYFDYQKVDELSFGKAPQTEEEWRRFQDYYFNAIQDSDNNIMDILDELQNLGLMENTVIIFTADHGDMMGAHNLRGKGGFIFENNIHVPLIIVHPNYPGGRTVGALTSALDIAPTIVDLTTATPDKKNTALNGIHGKSLLPLLEAPSNNTNALREGALYLFSDLQMMDAEWTIERAVDGLGNESFSYKMDTSKRGVVRGIFDGRYKFARYFAPDNFHMPETWDELLNNNDIELYDLEKDPNEMVNLAADPEAYKSLILEMNEKLNVLIQEEVGVDNGSEYRNLPVEGGISAIDIS